VRILLVAHAFPRRSDDFAGAFLLDLARGQRELGHEVCAVVPHDAGLSDSGELDGVTVKRFRYGPDADETLAYTGTMADQVLRSWGARWRLFRFVASMRRAVADAVRDFRPDVVHIHWWFPGGFAIWPGQGLGVPVVITSHGTDLFLADRAAPLRFLARRVLRAAHEITVISTPLVARAAALGVPHAHITVCPMPIRASDGPVRAHHREEPPTVLFLGRLTERKGTRYAIEAIDDLRAAGSIVHLRIVGDGPERAALEQLVESRQLRDRVTFTGAVSPEAAREAFASATLFVMPSVTDWKGEQEGFGLVLVEAMEAGVPVVASRSGGIPDIVRDGETGLLVPERNVAALAAAVARLLDDPALADRLAAAAQRDVHARFAPMAIARTFESVYRRARGSAA
jgi:glycosyltransferase involved in cell wall biosynthesis